MRRLLVCIVSLFTLLVASPVAAQDVLSRARQAPTRADGLAILETHLAATPADVDARTLYGLMLSWDGRYDEARRELSRVLAEAPEYTDARVGLMHVEWWSGNHAAARAESDRILSRDPGNAPARLVRQRLDAADRPWTAGVAVVVDAFSDDRSTWHEVLATVSRQTAAGAIVARAARAGRFDLEDEQFEIEFYPVLRQGTYALVAAGVSPDHILYPRHRLALEVYQSLGAGFEISAGYRRLAFDETVDIFGGSISKYAGPWLLSLRVNQVDAADKETSAHVTARRYFGGDGTSYAGVGYSRGLSRLEIRGAGDLSAADTDTIRADVSALVTPRVRLSFETRASRADRPAGTLWQYTGGAGVSIRF